MDHVQGVQRLASVLVGHRVVGESGLAVEVGQPRNRASVRADEVEHSEHEHAEGNEALLALMEVADTASEEFSEKLHELSEALTHHLDEEERDVLNPARTEVGEDVRRKLGDTFAEERSRLIDSGCGELANVRKIVAAEQHT